MQEAEKSNVVNFADRARRRTKTSRGEELERASAMPVRRGELCHWPRRIAPYPGGIDDLPV